MKSLEELRKIREEALKKVKIRKEGGGTRIVVGMDTCGIAAGARDVLIALVKEIKLRNIVDVSIRQTECMGVCRLEPIVEVYKNGEEKVTYVNVTPEKAKRVVEEHIVKGEIVREYTLESVK